MPGIDIMLSDEDFLIMRAKESNNLYSAKAWMLTAQTLFPTNFKVQFEAYLMEKQSGNVTEAAECFSSLMASQQCIPELLTEISAIANALKSPDSSFLSQMFDKIVPDIQLTILRTSVENSDDTMEHCKLLVLLLKKFPQLGADSFIKTLINAEKFFHDNRYARLLVVDTLPLLSSLESPRLLQRLLIKAIDYYNTYVHDETEHDIADPWQRLYAVLDLLGRQLSWDPYLLNYNNTLNKESYFQKLITLRHLDDCRPLLYCGTIYLLRSLYDQRAIKGNHILVEAFTDPDGASKCLKGDIEVTGASSPQFQAAANCWELLHSTDFIACEFAKLASQLQVKPWTEGFMEEIAVYHGQYEDAMPHSGLNNLSASLMRVSVTCCQKRFATCFDNMMIALSQMPAAEGVLETDLIVAGTHRHVHFLSLTKTAILHYFCTLLIRMILKVRVNNDLAYGHLLVLMQLGWPQEESVFINIMDSIRNKGHFQYHLFPNYIILVDILEEIAFMWNEHGSNIALDIIPQQHLGQRRIGTRGSDKGVKEDFKQTIKAQILRCNESLLNLMIQFITQECSNLVQLCDDSTAITSHIITKQ